MDSREKTLALVLVLVLTLVTVTTAHMAFSKSEPEEDSVLLESPHHIQIWFTQDPDPVVSQVRLDGPRGDVVLGELMVHDDKSIMRMVPSSLSKGEYKVSWRSAGEDGHIQRGEFEFTVRAGN